MYRFIWIWLFAVASVIVSTVRATACPFEKFWGSPHIQISQSPWVVDEWGQACGFGISGRMEIRAENETTHESRVIAKFGNIIATITISSDGPKLLTIKLPNLVDMTDVVTQLEDVKILYKFTPEDDPEARTNYQNWLRHPGDLQPRTWYCRNIFAKMYPANRATWNQVFGEKYPVENAPEPSYCPDQ